MLGHIRRFWTRGVTVTAVEGEGVTRENLATGVAMEFLSTAESYELEVRCGGLVTMTSIVWM